MYQLTKFGNFKEEKMKKMFRALLAGVVLLTLSGVAAAGDFSMDPSTVGSSTGNISNIFGFTFIGTSNIQYTSGTGVGVGDTFIDNGALNATSLKSSSTDTIPVATSELGLNWELGAIFNGLTGSNTSVTGDEVEFAFDAGSGIIQIYASPTINNQSSDPASIADGVLVAELELVSGTGDFDFDSGDGRVDIVAEFVSLPVPGFWDFLGVDIELGTLLFLAITDSNNDLVTVPAGTISNFDSFFGGSGANTPPGNFFVSNDGSVELQVSVPEPSTLLLLGSGLIGLAALVRRQSRKANQSSL
jgi:hypothetical protein